MLKFTGLNQENGKKRIHLGLTKQNWENLLKGVPLVVDGATLGYSDLEISLMGAEDNNTLMSHIKQAKDPQQETT